MRTKDSKKQWYELVAIIGRAKAKRLYTNTKRLAKANEIKYYLKKH